MIPPEELLKTTGMKIPESGLNPTFGPSPAFRSGLACAVFAFMASGCVTEIVESSAPITRTKLVVTRSLYGALISWPSEQGVFYTILYSSSRSSKANWKPLPGYMNILGTGASMQITDPAPSVRKRYYRLHKTSQPMAISGG